MALERTASKERWIQEGYKQFALHGPDHLSINQISHQLGMSRASFYHHFGDIDIFVDQLLGRHWEICQQFNREGKEKCRALIPDLYLMLAEYSIPLRFALQLFHHRSVPRFNYLFIKVYESSAKAFLLELFAEHLDLQLPEDEILKLWITLGESWYSRIDAEDLSAGSLQYHSEQIMESVSAMVRSDVFSVIKKTG